MKPYIIIICFLACVSCNSRKEKRGINNNNNTDSIKNMGAIQNDTTYTVWETYNCEGVKEGKFTNWSEIHINYELIKNLPVPVKTIIAHYSEYIPPDLDKKTELKFAQSLGGFITLEEARKTLLKDWKGKKISENYIYGLNLTKTENSLFFEYINGYTGKSITDEFKTD